MTQPDGNGLCDSISATDVGVFTTMFLSIGKMMLDISLLLNIAGREGNRSLKVVSNSRSPVLASQRLSIFCENEMASLRKVFKMGLHLITSWNTSLHLNNNIYLIEIIS